MIKVPAVMRRHWDMPSASTFSIPSVAAILRYHVGDGQDWADPFARRSTLAEHTNDINEEMPASHHLEAFEFLRLFEDCSLAGVLLDPPYSMRQIREKYDGYGNVKQITPVLREAARAVRIGGLAVSFGWNSNGVGGKHMFRLVSVDLVAHGGQHNDTIVTVEQKMGHQWRMFQKKEGQVMDDETKMRLCSGCRNDFYNHRKEGNCWHLEKAKVVSRTRVGIWQNPPYKWAPQKTLSCHTPEGTHWIMEDDPRIKKD